MRKFLIIFLVIVGIIMVFAFPKYTVTDYYGYDNMGADYLVRKPYSAVDYNNNFQNYVSFSYYSEKYHQNLSVNFYKDYLIKTDEYIYYIQLDVNKFGLHALNYLENHLAFIPLSIGDIGTLYVFMRSSDLAGVEIADESYSISQGVSGLISNDGFQLQRINNSDGSFHETGDILIDRATELAYDYFVGHIDYEFILDNNRTNNKSPFAPYSAGAQSFSSAASGFHYYYLLRNVGEYDSYTWFKGITTDIESLGPMPVLPDTDALSGIDLVSAYFSWVINEIVYVIKFGALILRGVL